MNPSTKSLISSKPTQLLLAPHFVFKGLFKDSTVIFLFHEVSNNPSRFYNEYDLNISPDVFEDQIKHIKSLFNIITPKDLIEGDYRKPAALITFDDGTAGYFEHAVPILAKHNCPSLIFLNMAPIQGELFYSGISCYLCDHNEEFNTFLNSNYKNELKPPLFLNIKPSWVEEFLSGQENREEIENRAIEFYGRFADENNLKECSNNKLVYFGNHLYRHYNSITCSEEELIGLYIKNRDALKSYPNYLDFFSYPYGQKNTCYNDKTNKIIQSLDPRAIFTAHPQTFSSQSNIFYRLPLTEDIATQDQLRAYLCLKRYKQFF